MNNGKECARQGELSSSSTQINSAYHIINPEYQEWNKRIYKFESALLYVV